MVAPVITITSVSKYAISRKSGQDKCLVRFKSNQDLVQWEARAEGTGHGSGTLVGNTFELISKLPNIILGRNINGKIIAAGSAGKKNIVVLKAGNESSFDVIANELTDGDKTYRITVYGKNKSGEWSKYG